MNVKELIYEMVLSAVEDKTFDYEQITAGIDEYIKDNGFDRLNDSFSSSVIESVIRTNLANILSMSPESIALYFSNYRLIEKVRVLNNQSLALAKAVAHGERPSESFKIEELEKTFDEYIKEVYAKENLKKILDSQIAEIIINLDYAKKKSSVYSRRLRDSEVKP